MKRVFVIYNIRTHFSATRHLGLRRLQRDPDIVLATVLRDEKAWPGIALTDLTSDKLRS